MDDRLTFTAKEAAQLIGVNYVTLLELARTKTFPAVWVGRRCVVPKAALLDWLNRQRGGGGSVL
jgi:excisionase family DNA binding protein